MLWTAFIMLSLQSAASVGTLLFKEQCASHRVIDMLLLVPSLMGAYAIWGVLH